MAVGTVALNDRANRKKTSPALQNADKVFVIDNLASHGRRVTRSVAANKNEKSRIS